MRANSIVTMAKQINMEFQRHPARLFPVILIYYYFIDFADIFFTIGNEHSVQLRYIINSNELNYNAIQALTQTAFATNASLSVIFKSPYLSQNLTTPGPYGRNLCYRYAGEGSSMVCHIDAMTILR